MHLNTHLAELAKAAEYAECISEQVKDSTTNECPEYDIE